MTDHLYGLSCQGTNAIQITVTLPPHIRNHHYKLARKMAEMDFSDR